MTKRKRKYTIEEWGIILMEIRKMRAELAKKGLIDLDALPSQNEPIEGEHGGNRSED